MTEHARIEWSPDGARFVTRLPDRRIRLHDVSGALIRPMGTACDARWADDEHVLSIDSVGVARWHGPIGVVKQQSLGGVYGGEITLAGRAMRWAFRRVQGALVELAVGGIDEKKWVIGLAKYDIRYETIDELALSPNGALLAIGLRPPGQRGFALFDVAEKRLIEQQLVATAPTDKTAAPATFGFDAACGVVVVAIPEAVAFESGRARVHGGSNACAIDERGAVAVFAHGSRLAFEFEGGATLDYDSHVEQIVALAFDPSSRWLACLDAKGAIEVVPVP